MKKGMLLGLGVAVAALLVSGPAAADDVVDDTEGTTEFVDWNDAVYYAELMDTWVYRPSIHVPGLSLQ
jgi:hypothetical protein